MVVLRGLEEMVESHPVVGFIDVMEAGDTLYPGFLAVHDLLDERIGGQAGDHPVPGRKLGIQDFLWRLDGFDTLLLTISSRSRE